MPALAAAMLFVTDAARVGAFYETALGLRRTGERGGLVTLEGDGGAALVLHPLPPGMLELAEPAVPRQDTALKLIFSVTEIEAAREGLVALGVPMGPVHRWEGVAYCDGVDPEGNVFQISQPRATR